MLARNAESLYWIGRYVERADDTARILDVSVHQLLEDATVNPDATSRQPTGTTPRSDSGWFRSRRTLQRCSCGWRRDGCGVRSTISIPWISSAGEQSRARRAG